MSDTTGRAALGITNPGVFQDRCLKPLGRDESNSRTWPRFNTLMTPMRAMMVGPLSSTTRSRAKGEIASSRGKKGGGLVVKI
jgi:hypothetical protein